MNTVQQISPDPDVCRAVLDLLHTCFAFMEDRIDPPSSLMRMSQSMVQEHARDQMVLGVMDGGLMRACLFVTFKPGSLYLGKLAVDPACRGKGLAYNLLTHAEHVARENQLTRLEVQVRIELIDNHAYFERFGFHETDRTSHLGFERPTSISFAKELASALHPEGTPP